jgi:hypothetical protein
VSTAWRSLLHKNFSPGTYNVNAQSFTDIHYSYPTVYRNRGLKTLHARLRMWVGILTRLHQRHRFGCFTHFDPVIRRSLWQTVLSGFVSQMSIDLRPFHSFRHWKRTAVCCISLMRTFNGAIIFMLCSFGTDGLQLNHTRSMSPPDLGLQYHQTAAVFSIRNVENIPIIHLLLFWPPPYFVYLYCPGRTD